MITDIQEKKEMIEMLDDTMFFSVHADINDKLLFVGVIARSHRCPDEFFRYASADELSFFRKIKTKNDVYSYNERTLSLNIAIYHLLKDLGVRMVVTEFPEELNLSLVNNYDKESDLGIGYLRRCDYAHTVPITRSIKIPFAERHCAGAFYAPPRETEVQHKLKRRANVFYDPRQDDLF